MEASLYPPAPEEGEPPPVPTHGAGIPSQREEAPAPAPADPVLVKATHDPGHGAGALEPPSPSAVTLALSSSGLRVELARKQKKAFGCAAAPAGTLKAPVLYNWEMREICGMEKTADGVDVTVQEDGGDQRSFVFVTRAGRKGDQKKQASDVLVLSFTAHAQMRHYGEQAKRAAEGHKEELERLRLRMNTEKEEAIAAVKRAIAGEQEENAEQAAMVQKEIAQLGERVVASLEAKDYVKLSSAMGEILAVARREDVHPRQRKTIEAGHLARVKKIEDLVSEKCESASRQMHRVTAAALTYSPGSRVPYDELGERLAHLLKLKGGLQAVISEAAYGRLVSTQGDQQAQLDAHISDLIQQATDESAGLDLVAGCADRLESICTWVDTDEGTLARADALWSQLGDNLTKLSDECVSLTAPAGATLQRTTTRRTAPTTSITDLGVKLNKLVEYRTVMERLELSTDSADLTKSVSSPDKRGTSGDVATRTADKAGELHQCAIGIIKIVDQRLQKICRDLRGKSLTGDEFRSEERCTEFNQALKTLKLYADHVDKHTGTCFNTALVELQKEAEELLTRKIDDDFDGFNKSLSAGHADKAEGLLKSMEDVCAAVTIAIEGRAFEQRADRLLTRVNDMQQRMATENDDTDETARAIFREGNYDDFKTKLLQLKSAAPESQQFVTFKKLQDWAVGELKKEYRKAERVLADPDRAGFAKVFDGLQALTDASPLEDCIEGGGYGRWRQDLQARIHAVCDSLRKDSLQRLQEWKLVAAEDAATHMQLYVRCPGVDISGALAEVDAARSSQMSALPAAFAVMLGSDGTDPKPQDIDTIVHGLHEVRDGSGSDLYRKGLQHCMTEVERRLDYFDSSWKASLLILDVKVLASVFTGLKTLSTSKVVAEHIKGNTQIDVVLNRRRLDEAKAKVLSPKHVRDTAPETLAKSLAGLRAVDPTQFGSGMSVLIGELSQQTDQLREGLRGVRGLESDAQLFKCLKREIDDLHKFNEVLQPHCETQHAEQLALFRDTLLIAWISCTKSLSADAHALRCVTDTSHVTLCRTCILDDDEKAKVDDAIGQFEEAWRKNGALVDSMIRVYREVITKTDCSEGVVGSAGALIDCLRNLEKDGALVPADEADVSFENAKGKLEASIRMAKEKALAADEEDYERIAQCTEGIGKLADVRVGSIDETARGAIDKITAQVRSQLSDLYKRGEDRFDRGDFKEVNKVMERLKMARKDLVAVSYFSTVLKECSVEKLEERMTDSVTAKMGSMMAQIPGMQTDQVPSVDLKQVADWLLDLYQVSSEINSKELNDKATQCMDNLLKSCEKHEDGLTGKKLSYDTLANFLHESEDGKGGEIIDRVPAFQKWMRERFNQVIGGASAAKSIPEIAKLNSFSEPQKSALEEVWKQYERKYNSMLEGHFKKKDVKAMVAEATADKSNIVDVIAGICTVWSLAGASPDEDSVSIIRPHCCQMLSIFVLLGLHESKTICEDGHLIEVKTGQGKSVLLGVLATLLAVLGFEVDCVCYSKYLSLRDEASFMAVFQAFGVVNSVNYDTFNGLAEASINAKGDVRELTTQVLIDNGGAQPLPAASTCKKVLLIDEVDVFFSDAFYGERYSPACVLRESNTDALQDFIWEHRNVLETGGDASQAKLVSLAKKTQEYKDLVSARPHMIKIFDGEVRLMVRDLGNVLSRDLTKSYEVVKPSHHGPQSAVGIIPVEPEPEPEAEMGWALTRSGSRAELWRIGYVDQDSVSTDMFLGYETLFCYYAEQEKYDGGDSSAHPMDFEHCFGLRIKCGDFSFAEMGRAGKDKNYNHILGVSGTLTCLGDYENTIIEETYQISKKSQAPSIFGENRMSFNKDKILALKDMEGYHQEIHGEIVRYNHVAVIVFFETDARLDLYKKYLLERGIQNDNLFAVSGDVDNIDHYVRQATRQGNATLLSRVHGRGLDFKCHNKRMDAAGGMHVVQTFLSEEESEEIQIRGRSARQEKSGTYQLICLRSDLSDKFGVGLDEPVTYEILNAKRKEWAEAEVQKREETVQAALERHTQSMKFAGHLCRGEFEEGMEFLNEPFQGGEKSVLFLLDYSGSMIGGRIKTSIEAIREVIAEHISEDDYVALTCFNDTIRHPLDWTQKDEANEPRIRRLFEKDDQIESIGKPAGATMLWDGVQEALRLAWSAPSSCWVVLLTDGDDTDSKGGGCSRGVGPRDPDRDRDADRETHRVAMTGFLKDALLPDVVRCSNSENKLGGLIAIPLGNEVTQETQVALQELVAASGVENGMIPAGKPEQLKEAFAQAAALMAETIVIR